MALRPTVATPGDTDTVLRVCTTVTVTSLTAESPAVSVIVTRRSYVPDWANVAVVLLAALVPFTLKVTPDGELPTAAQVYLSVDSPLGSAPSVLRATVVVVTFGVAAVAAVATVGPVETITTLLKTAVEAADAFPEVTANPV